jgi:hypothetical protein
MAVVACVCLQDAVSELCNRKGCCANLAGSYVKSAFVCGQIQALLIIQTCLAHQAFWAALGSFATVVCYPWPTHQEQLSLHSLHAFLEGVCFCMALTAHFTRCVTTPPWVLSYVPG